MKKIVLLLLIVSMAVATTQAQDMRPRKHRMQRDNHGMMAEKLNFSEDQKAKMKTMNEGFRTKRMDLRKNDNITVKEWKNRMETLRKDHKTKMEGLLTGEQKERIEKMKIERKAMRDIDAKARMDKMKIHLGLSDEQASKFSKNRSEMEEKMKALRENKTLDGEKKREQMNELMKQQKEKMKSILTEEQMKKLQERKGQRPPRREVI